MALPTFSSQMFCSRVLNRVAHVTILTGSVRFPARQIEYDLPTAGVSEKLCDDRNREREKAALLHLDATIAWCRGLDTADTAYAAHREKERSRKELMRGAEQVAATGIPQQEGGGAVPQESGSDSAAGAVSESGIALIAEVFLYLSAAAVVAQMLF